MARVARNEVIQTLREAIEAVPAVGTGKVRIVPPSVLEQLLLNVGEPLVNIALAEEGGGQLDDDKVMRHLTVLIYVAVRVDPIDEAGEPDLVLSSYYEPIHAAIEGLLDGSAGRTVEGVPGVGRIQKVEENKGKAVHFHDLGKQVPLRVLISAWDLTYIRTQAATE